MSESRNQTSSNLVAEILDIVAKEAMAERERLKPDVDLADLDIQSADYVMILMAIEERYGVYISVDEELSEAKTVGDLCDLVVRNIESSAEGTPA